MVILEMDFKFGRQELVIKTKQIYPTRVEGLDKKGGARGEMVIVVGNEHGDLSSNPGRE